MPHFLHIILSVCVQLLGCVWPHGLNPWTVAHQAPLTMGFSRQEHWSGLPCPPPGDLPNPGIKLASSMSPALAGRFFTTVPPRKLLYNSGDFQFCCQVVLASETVHGSLISGVVVGGGMREGRDVTKSVPTRPLQRLEIMSTNRMRLHRLISCP